MGTPLLLLERRNMNRKERRRDSKNRVLKTGEYQRANGTYEYRWTDKIGRRHAVYAPSLTELRDKEEEIVKSSIEGKRVDANKLTVDDVYQMWCDLKRGLKENTFSNYRYMYEMFVKDTLGRCRIVDLKRSDIRGFYNSLHDVRGLKPATIDCVHTVLHQVLDIAVDDEYIRYNPCDKALKELKKAYSNENGKKTALTVPQMTLLLRYLKNSNQYRHWYPIIVTMIYTGMRIGEITGLRWEDVDMENGLIHVTHTLVYYSKREKGKDNHQIFAINSPKTPAGYRTIPMLPIVKEALNMQREYLDEAGISCKVTIDGYTNFVFLNRFGETLHQGTVNKALRRIIRDCNFEVMDKEELCDKTVLLPQFSCHTLRHTMSTRMNEAGINDKVRMAVMGHTDIKVTQDIYTDVFDDYAASELAKMDKFAKE